MLEASLKHYDALYDAIISLDDYKRFEHVLKDLSIPYKPFTGDLQVALNKILPAVILSDEVQDSVTPAAALRERQQEDDSSPQLLVELE